jgi:hypothetical protein
MREGGRGAVAVVMSNHGRSVDRLGFRLVEKTVAALTVSRLAGPLDQLALIVGRYCGDSAFSSRRASPSWLSSSRSS